jgi:hypothetical protein
MTKVTTFRNATTQREKTLAYLIEHGTITPLRAQSEFGETRLAARIEELRNEGWGITTVYQTAKNGRAYAEYSFNGRQRTQNAVCLTGGCREFHPAYPGAMPKAERKAA